MFKSKVNVDSILSEFKKTITKLDDLSASEMANAYSKKELAESLKAEAETHEAEADRAVKVATKLQALIV